MPAATEALPGGLYVVATPIGHHDDITLRALNVLRTVDCIAAEDTRLTGRLLAHHGIQAHLISYHEHNEHQRTPLLLARLQDGQRVALVSDAGTPSLSDPGFILVREAAAAGLRICPVPGPSAALAALSVSGLATDAFIFLGFPPRKPRRREQHLRALQNEPRTLIWYESPRRLAGLLEALLKVMGDRAAVVGREMTKRYEEFLRGSVSQLAARVKARPEIKGEITLLVAGCPKSGEVDRGALVDVIRERLAADRPPASALARELAAQFDLPRSQIYDMIMDIKQT
ncbi:MAG: 16S rRNA (cytidine(1402)-2'-O)-methyltransferase [Desulfobacterales bacterium]|nr:16S rRNA (cytidine(1402)-2'-O)-methyltransferase [Desulfobacterales bacterium]